jgi:hypothetical protein
MIRNYGGDKEGLKEICGGAKDQQRRPSQVGVPIQVELKSNSYSRNSHTKIIAQITYQLRFGRSLYGWKDKRINFPMEPVSSKFLLSLQETSKQ